MKKILIFTLVLLVLASALTISVFAQAESTETSGEEKNAMDEMPPMEFHIDGEAFLVSLGLMAKGMIGIFVVTLVIIGVVAILNWHGKTLEDRNNRK